MNKEKSNSNATITEAIIILGGMGSLTVALVSGRLSETVYAALVGTFMGYTIGRIFNRVQNKE